MSTNSELPIKDKNPGSIEDTGTEVDPKYFNDYLINYREGLWLSIRQKENGVWQFIAFFAGAIVIVAGILEGNKSNGPLTYLTLGIMSMIVVLVSFWGVAIILDANFWEKRNLWIHSNIEWKLLGKREIGKIIPLSYANPDFDYSRVYSLHIYLLFIILNLILGGNIIFLKQPNLYNNQTVLIAGVLGIIISVVVSFINNRDQEWVKKYHNVRATMIGDRDPNSFENYSSFYQFKNIINSPLLLGSYILSAINLYFAIFILPLIGIRVSYIISTPVSIFLIFFIVAVFPAKIIAGGYIRKGDELIKNKVKEIDLMKNQKIRALKTSTLALSKTLIIINLISSIAWVIIAVHAYLSL